jgi:hypothetical protein
LNVQLLEVRELTDGLWDGLELVVVEGPVKKRQREGEPKGADAMIEQQNVHLLEAREMTDGLWDGLELVVVEVPVIKSKEKRKSQKVQMR